jgi:hypothetical protein
MFISIITNNAGSICYFLAKEVAGKLTLAMTNDNLLPFSFPAVSRKQVTAVFEVRHIRKHWPETPILFRGGGRWHGVR